MAINVKAEIIDRDGLTPRECEVLALVCEGDVDKAIARKLAIGLGTVKTHVEHLYIKLDVREASINARCAAISTAVARGLVKLSTTSLCLMLMYSAGSFDSHALRMSSARSVSASGRLRHDA